MTAKRNPLLDPRPIAGGDGTDETDDTTQDINAQLARIDALSQDELQDLRSRLVDEARAAYEAEGGPDTERMAELAGNVDVINEKLEAMSQLAAERQAEADELLSRTTAHVEADAAPDTEELSTDADDTTVAIEAENVEVVTAAAEPAPRPTIRQLSARQPVASAPRVTATDQTPVTITASGDVPGHSAGSELTPQDVGDAFARKVQALMGSQAGSRYPVATVHAQYPEDRVLVAGGSDMNTERITHAMDGLQARMHQPMEAIIASGGLCAPVEARYDLAQLATAVRPVRDALERFNAARGGVRFITPPTLAGLASGVSVWTAANDANPTAPTVKPCVVITCGTEVTVTIDAVTLCIQVGNFARMTFPEQFARWYSLGLAAHARVAETHLLDGIYAASTKVTQAQELGAARDIIGTYIRAAAAYRNRNRMAADATLTALLPAWLPDAMAADVTKQEPGDDEIGTQRDEIVGWLRTYNVEPSFYLDERTGGGQIYAAQGAGALLGFKGTVDGYLFHPGAFMFLDGGTLDLGVDIRDSALNSTNDVKAFMETFENVAFNGIESLNIVNTILVNGISRAAA